LAGGPGAATCALSARCSRSSAKRRKLSAFDVAIIVLWVSATLGFTLSGVRQDALQVIKSLMTPGLLAVIYGLD